MNSFDIDQAYQSLKTKQGDLETLAENAEEVLSSGGGAEELRSQIEEFTQAMGEYNLGEKVMMTAAKNNFSIEQQVLQELKQ
jgi:hypothetical protein